MRFLVMQDLLLLEHCPKNVKLWYILNIRKFLIDTLTDDEIFITKRCGLYIATIANKIKLKYDYDDFGDFCLISSDYKFYSKRFKNLYRDKKLKTFIKEHHDLIIISLLKDFIEINYELTIELFDDIDGEDIIDFINSNKYLSQEHMLFEENGILVDFIQDNNFDLGLVRDYELCYSELSYLLQYGTDKNLLDCIKKREAIFIDYNKTITKDYAPLSALYFSGAPFGLPATDFVGAFSVILQKVNKAKTIAMTAVSLATLSNPITCSLGLASLGISTLSSISKNKYSEQSKIKKILLQALAENYNQTKQYLLHLLDNTALDMQFCFNLNSYDDDDSCVIFYHVISICIMDIIGNISLKERDFINFKLNSEVPRFLDIKRFNNLTKNINPKIKEFVLKCYEYDDESCVYVYVDKNTIPQVLRLIKIFDSIGYFSMTGYLQKFNPLK